MICMTLLERYHGDKNSRLLSARLKIILMGHKAGGLTGNSPTAEVLEALKEIVQFQHIDLANIGRVDDYPQFSRNPLITRREDKR